MKESNIDGCGREKEKGNSKESGKDDCFYNKVNVEKLRAHHEKRRSISKPVALDEWGSEPCTQGLRWVLTALQRPWPREKSLILSTFISPPLIGLFGNKFCENKNLM